MVMFDIYDTSAEAYLKGTGIGDTAYFGTEAPLLIFLFLQLPEAIYRTCSSVLVNPSKTGRVRDLG